MGERSYTTVDKTEWGDGPWQQEPDKLSWTDETTGMPCLIVRNRSGALCGYVGVNPDHPWHGTHYDEPNVDVHGGLTFSDGCGHGDNESTGICHIPEPGQPDDVWWFGFDCNHAFDLAPQMQAYYGANGMEMDDEIYRSVPYVRDQVASLAVQLAAVS